MKINSVNLQRNITVFISLLFIGIIFHDSKEINTPSAPVQTAGSVEDLEGRSNYNWMRLHSPKTGEIPRNIRSREIAFAATLPTKESLALRLNKPGSPNEVRIFNWARRGPFNVGGRTRALAIDVADLTERTILAGGVSGGMWKSTNLGSSWTKTTGSSDLHSVTALIQDTRAGKTGTWYYGTGEFTGNSARGGGSDADYLGDGIFKSTDGGNSWTQLSATVSGTPQTFESIFDFVWNIGIDPSNMVNDEVYAAVYGSIKRSTDGGTTWSDVLGGSEPWSPYTDMAISSSGVVYAVLSSAGISKGIWRSVDGDTWTEITPAGWPISYERIVLDIAPSNENVVYFLAETRGSGKNDHSLWKYTDNGAGSGTWEDRSAFLPADGGEIGNFDSQRSYDILVKVKPNDENTVFIGGTSLYRSTDGFSSSSNTAWIGGYSPDNVNVFNTYPSHHPDQHSLVFYPNNPNWMLSGNDGGVMLTIDNTASGNGNVQWIPLNKGYFTTQFYSIAVEHTDPGATGRNIIIGGMQDNGTFITTSAFESVNWLDVFGGDGSISAIADARKHYYVSSQNGTVFRFTLSDLGTSTEWTQVDPVGGTDYLFINPFILDPNNTDRMYLVGGKIIWRNSDLTAIASFVQEKASVNWAQITGSQVPRPITALAMAKTPANRLYYGTDTAQLYRLDNANTNGSTFNTITGANFPFGSYVSCIAVDRENADNVLVVFSNYEVPSLFYSSDGGVTWTDVSGNLEDASASVYGEGDGPSTRWAVIHSGTGGPTAYFVGTSIGIFSTFNLNGTNTVWVQEGASEIGNVVVDMIDNRASDGLVVVATHGTGVFSSAILTSVEDEKEPGIPTRYSLRQNYPNPFNPVTTIGFNLQIPGAVSLFVYNTLGQRVRSLILNENKSPGNHQVIFDGRNDSGVTLPSGIYFYQLVAGDFSDMKKMMIIK